MASSFGGRNLINLDMFTDAYRVTGRTQVGSGGILAELSNPNTKYLEIQDAYVSRIQDPGTIVTSYKMAAFRKDNINFLLLQDRRDGIPTNTAHTRSAFSRGREIPVFVTVPSFEIQGVVIHEGKVSVPDILIQSMGRFQSIFTAKASASIQPDISYSGDLIMVQKDRIGVFCVDLQMK